jgi:diguanylate cyclase (GGDEF)-like protein/PAS domain S-box-containing protein
MTDSSASSTSPAPDPSGDAVSSVASDVSSVTVASSWPLPPSGASSTRLAIGLPTTWQADPLRVLGSLTDALRRNQANPAHALTGALTGPLADRTVLWSVSFDGTRARLISVDGASVSSAWAPASGPVAETLGARQVVEMGVLDAVLVEGLVTASTGRLAEDDARDAGRVFGRFVPMYATPARRGLPGPTDSGGDSGNSGNSGDSGDGGGGRRIVAVLGVLRRPGRPPFDVADRIVLDTVAERYEASLAARNAGDELRSAAMAGMTPSGGGVTLGRTLLDRLGEISGDVVFRHLFSGRTDYISSGIVASLGYAPEEVLADGRLLNRLVHPDDRHLLSEIVEDASRCERPLTIRMLRRNGQISWQFLRLAPILGPADEGGTPVVLGIEGFATDITPSKQAEAELVHQARSDVLTGLANRLAFRESVQRTIARLERHAGMSGVLFLDLDGFKKVNDTHGHAAGDDVLRQVADTLRRVIRREDLVARLGGDEFAVLLSELRTVDEGAATARRILAAFEDTPVMAGGEPADVSTGIGIAVVTDPATSPDELINRADIALYQAKRAGRGRWQVYDGATGTASVDQPPLDLPTTPPTTPAAAPASAPGVGTTGTSATAAASAAAAALAGPIVTDATARAALAARDFRVHFLPEVESGTGRVVAVEALLRWQHPTLGLLPASVFIDRLVGLETIHAIGDWALREACRQVASWRERYRVPLQLWINAVPAQIVRPGFAETVLATISASGLSPRDVGLDVAEATLPALTAVGEEALATLGRAGVRLAIDDFGGGTTSLRTLQRLPLHQIKLDRALVEALDRTDGMDSSDLVGMAVSLAGSLGADVVAVGVERQTQLAQVQALQCAYVQGYLAGHALSADEVETVLQAGHPTLPGL